MKPQKNTQNHNRGCIKAKRTETEGSCQNQEQDNTGFKLRTPR